MKEITTKREVVDAIKTEIEKSKDTRIWSDYVNALKLISQVVFTRSSGFILELIQNAEDSGAGSTISGTFEIRINKQRIKITHNGHPFDENDVKSICGIRSSKKPEKGTLGYLGIGFKSVFKVTDCPEIYSNDFQFKFDKNAWKDPNDTPWYTTPLWIDKPSETIELEKTTFIIPFREENYYWTLEEEIKNIRTELYLFLRWLKKIEVIDEASGESWTLENLGESSEGFSILKQGSEEKRFKFFRRQVKVPEQVRRDELTKAYRANVEQREISIAFALDSSGNLSPSEAGAMYGGVYSFLALGEAKSGAKFPIQADFLVQPGRDAVNYEAKWNQWLLEEVASLCKEAIIYFKKHDRWKYQFLTAFEFTKSKGESYEKLFGPKLIEPIEKFLNENECVPTLDKEWSKLENVVRLSEGKQAAEDMINMNILEEDEIAPVLGGSYNLKLVSPEFIDSSNRVNNVDRDNLLNNNTFLEKCSKKTDATGWFRNLYLWLEKNPAEYKSGKKYYKKQYHGIKFILTSKSELERGGQVYLPDLPPSDPILKELAEILQKSKSILHPDILGGTKDSDEQKKLRGFLTGFTGVQILDGKTVCREALFPKILSDSPKPSQIDLIKHTINCKQILQDELGRGLEFWVLTKKGDIRPAKEVLFSSEYKPCQNWETNQKYINGLNFLSPQYIEGVTDDQELEVWREFFESGGIRNAPDNGVEEFGMNYAQEKLKSKYTNIMPVEKRNFGYDLEAETQKGEKIQVEVKGQSSESDAELTDNETDAADKYEDTFYLCIVSTIPETPTMYMVRNPSKPGVGKKEKLTIPINVWKGSKW